MIKKKIKKKTPKVVIGNPAVTAENIKEALNFKAKKPKKYKFLQVVLSFYPGAVVISWSAKAVGFGELTFHLSDGRLSIDTEGMSQQFVDELLTEVLKQHKKGSLKVTQGDNLIPRMLERFYQELKLKGNVKFK